MAQSHERTHSVRSSYLVIPLPFAYFPAGQRANTDARFIAREGEEFAPGPTIYGALLQEPAGNK